MAKRYYLLSDLFKIGSGDHKPCGNKHHMVLAFNTDGSCTVKGSRKGKVTIKPGDDALSYDSGYVWHIKKSEMPFRILRQRWGISILLVNDPLVDPLKELLMASKDTSTPHGIIIRINKHKKFQTFEAIDKWARTVLEELDRK